MHSSQLEHFLDFVQHPCPWFPDEGTVNEITWARVGEKLWDQYTAERLAQMPIFTFTLWALIRDALDPHEEELKVKKSTVNILASTVEGYTFLLLKPPMTQPAPLAEHGEEPLPPDNARELGVEAPRTEREKEEDDSEEEENNVFPDPENSHMQGLVRQL